MSKAKLTERDGFWLGHLEAIEREGVAAKAYAKRRRLSVDALYQAKKRKRSSNPVFPGFLKSASLLPSIGGKDVEGEAHRARWILAGAPRGDRA